ncbi:MAG: histidine kinase dimerization/phospho-acceptor domain-containing protein [Pseudomonadota bacterium]
MRRLGRFRKEAREIAARLGALAARGTDRPGGGLIALLSGFVWALGALAAAKALSEPLTATSALGYLLAFLAVAGVVLALGVAFVRETEAARSAQGAVRTLDRMTRALAGGRCGAWFFDPDTERLTLSRPLGAALGFSGETRLSLRDIASLAHPDDARALFTFFVSERGDEEIAARLSPDGRAAWRRVRFRRSPGDDVSGAAFLTGGDDSSLTDDPIRLRTLLDSAAEAAAMWTAEGDLIASNARFEALAALEPAPDALGALVGPLGAGEEARTDACAADGRWLQIRRKRTGDGGSITLVTDVTAMKRRDETLRDQEREIDRIASALAQAEHRADLAGRSRTEFLANMSHELRTPLNAINGFSQLIQSEPFGPLGDPRYRDYLDDILASGRRLLELVDDMLDMSKISAGEFRIAPAGFDVAAALKEVVEAVRQTREGGRASISLQIRGAPDAFADRGAARQAIGHLLSNAMKYAREGGTVTVACFEEDGSAVVLVGDDGPGIEAETLSRLGAPFELAEDHLSKTAQGAGLGLAIVRALMEMQAGVFAIASEPGAGTLAALSFPKREGAAAAVPSALPRSARILVAPPARRLSSVA